jgi:hypothetical protein
MSIEAPGADKHEIVLHSYTLPENLNNPRTGKL